MSSGVSAEKAQELFCQIETLVGKSEYQRKRADDAERRESKLRAERDEARRVAVHMARGLKWNCENCAYRLDKGDNACLTCGTENFERQAVALIREWGTK